MDGLSATKHIRNLEKKLNKPRTVIIALSANNLPEDKKNCFEIGMDEFLSKPVKQEQLANVLFQLIPKKS